VTLSSLTGALRAEIIRYYLLKRIINLLGFFSMNISTHHYYLTGILLQPHYEKVARLFNGPDAVHPGIVLMTRVDCASKVRASYLTFLIRIRTYGEV